MNLAFGPVNSRRLGSSLGVNNIPYKHCTYSCVYCQLGKTRRPTIKRRAFYDPKLIIESVRNLARPSINIDYITFVPDGEPTLDSKLGLEIEMLKENFSKPIAVLTNSSLLWMKTVREDLEQADLVSLKIDAAVVDVWKKLNRPHKSLSLDKVVNGIMEFASSYRGILITETMLVRGLNDSQENLELVAELIAELRPKKAYISIPIRPPTEKWVKPPSEATLLKAYDIFMERARIEIELLTSIEPPPRTTPDNPLDYILATTMVHPLKLDYALEVLEKHYSKPQEKIEELEIKGLIKIVEHEGQKFVMRKL